MEKKQSHKNRKNICHSFREVEYLEGRRFELKVIFHKVIMASEYIWLEMLLRVYTFTNVLKIASEQVTI